MEKFELKSKKNMYYSIFFFLVVFIYILSSYKGLNFPKEEALNHTTGVFDVKKNAKLSYHVLISSSGNSSQHIRFSCAYTPLRSGRASSCGDKKKLAPYIGKEVTIGWYKQDSFFGLGSSLPQLVTIKVENQEIRSYKRVADSIESSNSLMLRIFLPLSLLCPFFFYWLYNKQDENAKLKKSK